MTQDEKYMKAAIREAKKAYALDEVPIGCVSIFMCILLYFSVLQTVDKYHVISYNRSDLRKL